jgi:hypothetical protein
VAKTIRPGTHVKTLTDAGRIRHVRVLAVDDQDNIDVRLGNVSNATSSSFSADRVTSTTTRGTIFSED